MIIVNRSIAEELVLNRLREERALKLIDLDIAYMRGLEIGADISSVVAEKQALREVTKCNLSVLGLQELAALNIAEALLLMQS